MSGTADRPPLRCRRCGAVAARTAGPLLCDDCGAPLHYECPRHGTLDGPECDLCAAARAEAAARARLRELVERAVSRGRSAR